MQIKHFGSNLSSSEGWLNGIKQIRWNCIILNWMHHAEQGGGGGVEVKRILTNYIKVGGGGGIIWLNGIKLKQVGPKCDKQT